MGDLRARSSELNQFGYSYTNNSISSLFKRTARINKEVSIIVQLEINPIVGFTGLGTRHNKALVELLKGNRGTSS